MSTPPRSRRGATGPARPGAIGPAIKLLLGAVFVATLAYVGTLIAGAAAGAAVPVASLLAGIGLLAFFVIVYAFAPGPL
ncbi:hypothetical protein [Haloglomus litoreum]|uniref:hypothetical protein n=1 Tax=Haloglomus litoreum TaxID=3034026 RepID=UPI0023E85A5B|nr:hypothetical protein [Haloglomus sp. DT116]